MCWWVSRLLSLLSIVLALLFLKWWHCVCQDLGNPACCLGSRSPGSTWRRTGLCCTLNLVLGARRRAFRSKLEENRK